MLLPRKIKYLILAILVAAGGVWVAARNGGGAAVPPVAQTAASLSSAAHAEAPVSSVTIGQTVISVELAATTEAVQKGLAGRTSLDPHAGMLFIFSNPAVYRFWMQGMQFPLDIIWIHDGKVVDITERALNDFDPAHPRFYIPSAAVRYVLEVNAGFVARTGIRIGDPVTLSGI